MNRPHGLSLGTTLLVAALVATLGLALASLSITHLRLGARLDNSDHARNLARSAAALTLEELLSNPSYGLGGTGDVLRVAPDWAPEGSVGLVTFDPAKAGELGIPCSTNNLKGLGSIRAGTGMVVPPEGIHLVAVGRYAGVTRQVEVVLRTPPYPYAIASRGRIVSEGGLLLAGVEEIPADPGAVQPDSEDLLPADLVANAGGAEAVVLAPDTIISGDVQTPGRIAYPGGSGDGPGVVVRGEIREGAEPAEVPRLDLADYDPRVSGRPYQELRRESYQENPTVMNGVVRRAGSLTIPGGGLKLDGCLLFVERDLTVFGGVSGDGVVVVGGDTAIQGGVDFVTDNQVALLGRGDIRIQGSSPRGSYFQGLVYTEGNLDVDHIAVVGTLIGARENTEMRLRDLYLLKTEESSRVVVTTALQSQTQTYYLDTQGDSTEDRPPFLTITVEARTDGTYLVSSSGGLTSALDSVTDRSSLEPEILRLLLLALRGDGYAPPLGPPGGGTTGPLLAQKCKDLARQYADAAPNLTQTQSQTTVTEQNEIRVDPNKFLKLQDTVRVVLWKES